MILSSTHYRSALALGLAWFGLALPIYGEETPSRFSIVGLFSPDRQKDLRDVLEDVPELQLVRVDFDSAEVALRYDMKKLFPNADPKKAPTEEQVLQRLNNFLVSASQGTFRLMPISKVPEDKLTKLDIDIGILDCKACRYGAYRAVMRIDGVERATVSASPSRISAWIDGKKTARAALEDALKKAGVALASK